MENHRIYQTALDQLVSSDQTQMLKALLPYMPVNMQSFLSFYTKALELSNTIHMFSPSQCVQICSEPVSEHNPAEIIQEIRQYCSVSSRQKLDQINNLLVTLEILSLMNTD